MQIPAKYNSRVQLQVKNFIFNDEKAPIAQRIPITRQEKNSSNGSFPDSAEHQIIRPNIRPNVPSASSKIKYRLDSGMSSGLENKICIFLTPMHPPRQLPNGRFSTSSRVASSVELEMHIANSFFSPRMFKIGPAECKAAQEHRTTSAEAVSLRPPRLCEALAGSEHFISSI